MSRRKVLGDKYKVGEVLGQGAFSTVYECVDMETRVRYAVKVLNKVRLQREGMEDAFEREIAAMKAVKISPHVTNLVEVLASGRNYYLVMELADGGTLFTMIAKNGGLPRHILRKYFRQLVVGLNDIHESGVVHRDIKPENLLLDEYRELRIADFSFAACADDTRVLKRQCGSPHYVAPDVLTGEGYNGRAVDIWSLGVTLFAMAFGQMPFLASNTDKLYEKIQAGRFSFPVDSSGNTKGSEALRHLITVCLRTDPKKRWTLSKIMRHPWVLGREELPKVANPSHGPLTSPSGGLGISVDDAGSPAFCLLPNTNDSFAFGTSALCFEDTAAANGLLQSHNESFMPSSNSCPALPTAKFFPQKSATALVPAPSAVGNSSIEARRKGLERKRSTVVMRSTPVSHTPETPESSASGHGGKKPPLVKRLSWEHVVCAVNLFFVSMIVLVIGGFQLLFDIKVANLPMPKKLRDILEAALTPPVQKKREEEVQKKLAEKKRLASMSSMDDFHTSADSMLESVSSGPGASCSSPPGMSTSGQSPRTSVLHSPPARQLSSKPSMVSFHTHGSNSLAVTDDDIQGNLKRGSLAYQIGDWRVGGARVSPAQLHTEGSGFLQPQLSSAAFISTQSSGNFDDFDFTGTPRTRPPFVPRTCSTRFTVNARRDSPAHLTNVMNEGERTSHDDFSFDDTPSNASGLRRRNPKMLES